VILFHDVLISSFYYFNGQFYEQTDRVTMGSPLSPVIASFFMEDFEEEALKRLSTNLFVGSYTWTTCSRCGLMNRKSWMISTVTSAAYTTTYSSPWRLRQMATCPSWILTFIEGLTVP
jgi:hypothetical protein